jgi:ribosomal protein S18 acetylase RimI-like enzyme
VTVTLHHGLTDELRAQAAALYWGAFGDKLGQVMGPTPKAIAFLHRALDSHHVIVALSDQGHLLGMVGFKTFEGSFAGGDDADLRKTYGRFGAFWRATLLGFLEQGIENERFLLDGICVTAAAQGQGIGTLLLHAICAEAKTRGYTGIRLDVVSSNLRARALYERFGFEMLQTEPLGLLRYIFGFKTSIAMVKTL